MATISARVSAVLWMFAASTAWAAPPAVEAPADGLWVPVERLRGHAVGSPKAPWRSALRDDRDLRRDARGLRLFYVLEVGTGASGQITVEVRRPVATGRVTLAPGTYHVVATRLARAGTE